MTGRSKPSVYKKLACLRKSYYYLCCFLAVLPFLLLYTKLLLKYLLTFFHFLLSSSLHYLLLHTTKTSKLIGYLIQSMYRLLKKSSYCCTDTLKTCTYDLPPITGRLSSRYTPAPPSSNAWSVVSRHLNLMRNHLNLIKNIQGMLES